ncbi:MAG: hypothetical protein ACRCS8_00630 [Brevinema sp.]
MSDQFSKIKWFYFIPLVIYTPLLVLRMITGVTPYYLYMDSNAFYALDSLLINGRLMPTHLFHPDVATLWFEKIFIFPIAKILGFISISTIQELQNSSNPYLNFVDIVEFLKNLRFSYLYIASSIFYIACITLLKGTLDKLSKLSSVLVIISLGVLSFQYISTVQPVLLLRVRYEHMAVLWASLSFFMTVYAAQTNQIRYILLMGFFAGMAFTSKMIVLPILILFLMMYVALNSFYRKDKKEYFRDLKQRKQTNIWAVIISITILSSFILSMFLFHTKLLKIGSCIAAIKSQYLLLSSIPLISTLVTLPLLTFIVCRLQDSFHKLAYYLNKLVLYVGALFLPLLLQLFQSNGVHIFANGFLSSFGLSQIMYSVVTKYNDSVTRIKFSVISILIIIVLLIISLYLIFLAYKKERKDLVPIALATSSLPIIITLNKLLLRVNGNEVELGFYSIFISLFVITYLTYNRFPKEKFLVMFLLLVIPFQIYHNIISIRKTALEDIKGETFHMSKNGWSYKVYTNNDGFLYREIISAQYGTDKNGIDLCRSAENTENWEKAFYWARDIYTVKRLLRQVGGNPNQLQNSFISFQGVNLSDSEILTNISDKLKNSLVLPIITDGNLGTSFAYDFYVITDKKIAINEQDQNSILLTTLKFNDYFVYSIPAGVNFEMDSSFIKYVLIADSLAKSI